MRKLKILVVFLLHIICTVSTSAQTPTTKDTDRKCTFLKWDMEKCGKPAVKSTNRCKSHHPNRASKKAIEAYWRKVLKKPRKQHW